METGVIRVGEIQMGRSRSLGRNMHALLALLFILANLAAPAAFADEQTDTADVLVSVFNCPYDPGNVTVTAGTMPSDCTPAIGITMSIQAETPDGTTSCMTSDKGVCLFQVVNGTAVTVWEDTSLLNGTIPRQNPVGVSAVLDYTELTFINVVPQPTAVPTDVPTAVPTDVPTEAPTEAPTAVPTDIPTEVPPPTVPPTPEPTQPVTPQRSLIQSQTTDKTYEPSDTTTKEDPSPTATSASTATATATSTATATTTPTATATAGPTKTPTPTKTPVTPTPAPVTKTYATVSGTDGLGLRCRASDSTSSAIITVLPEGTKVEVRGAESGGWIPVNCAGTAGWIYAGYATKTTETTTPDTSTPTVGTAKVVNTYGAGLRCRASASTSAAIITVLPEGSTVETRGAESGGWIPVKCAGQNGYIFADYASVSNTPPASNPTPSPTKVPTDPVSGETGFGYVRNTGGGGLNCRASASLSGSVITILAEGSKVETRGAASGDWVPVKCAGQNGWVFSSYFVVSTNGSTPTPAPTQAPTPAPGKSVTAMVYGTGGGGLNCRTGPSTSNNVITILPEGASVTSRGAESGGWLPVTCAGQAGWVSTAYLLMDGSGGTATLWIDVNLSSQYMRVYRGNTVIGETYVSTGRYGFETPPGTFYINWKLPSQTMTGVLGGEYYYVPDVPWVMYFTDRGHAIHGAYWHNNFGYPMSHGCVNLPVDFAAWLYGITPVGTKVYIHY